VGTLAPTDYEAGCTANNEDEWERCCPDLLHIRAVEKERRYQRKDNEADYDE
jgi:hypothetical protein